MRQQVIYYGNSQKAGMLLACVQAALENCSIGKLTSIQRGIVDRYAADLEEIERDLVSLITVAGVASEDECQEDGGGLFGATDKPNTDVR